MRVDYYYYGKKVTKSYLMDVVGEDTVKRLLADAKEVYKQDSNTKLEYCNGVGFVFKL